MEIWVRSQSKEFLKLCNEFRICERVKNKKIIGYSIDCFDVELGVYSTEEKALKTLDMIEEFLKQNSQLEIIKCVKKRHDDVTISGYEYAFQMPEDEEVEE